MQIKIENYNTALTKYSKLLKFKNTKEWMLINFWQDLYLVPAVKLGPTESRTNGTVHQPKWNFWEKPLGIVFWTTKEMNNNTNLKQHPYQNIPTTIQKKLVAAYQSDATFQTTKTGASLHPQMKMFKRETSKEMAGDRNRPLGLLLKRTKMMIFLYDHPPTPMSSERFFPFTWIVQEL